jgi:TrmH family RNA methyltransferase
MLSKNKIKEIRALTLKKHRDEQGLFIAEGDKTVSDLLTAFECNCLIARRSWLSEQNNISAQLIEIDTNDRIEKLSLMKTPQNVFAVFHKPAYNICEATPASGLILALDGIQDPGNVGTIARIAAWFGIQHVVCSLYTADVFSPKAVQAAMGALAKVCFHYINLNDYLDEYKGYNIYGTFLEGNNIYNVPLSSNGIIVMGNEGNGITTSIAKKITTRLHIPPFPNDLATVDSLNVAVATAVVCSEFRRRSSVVISP